MNRFYFEYIAAIYSFNALFIFVFLSSFFLSYFNLVSLCFNSFALEWALEEELNKTNTRIK